MRFIARPPGTRAGRRAARPAPARRPPARRRGDHDRVQVELGDRRVGVGERADPDGDVRERVDVASARVEQREERSWGSCPALPRARAERGEPATSPSTSAVPPPAPQATTGPKRSSASTPTSISTPGPAIRWTRKSSTASRPHRAACAISCAARADRGRAGEAEPHRPGLRLVHDAGRDALERHRPAELGGGLRRGRDRGDTPLLDQRDPVGGEQRRDLVRAQPAAAAGERAGRIAAAASASSVEPRRLDGGVRPAAGVGGGAAERASGSLGRAEVGILVGGTARFRPSARGARRRSPVGEGAPARAA